MSTSTLCVIEQAYLTAVLKSAARFCSQKNSYLPVLQRVLMRGETDRIHATGTDLDHTGTASTPAQAGQFAFAIDPEIALKWLNQIRSSVINIGLADPSRLEFSANNRSSRLTVLAWPGEEFPVLPHADAGSSLSINAIAFAEVVHAVLPFAPKASKRASQLDNSAVFFRAEGKHLVIGVAPI